MVEKFTIKTEAQKHIDAYAQYYNLVGNADGGKLFSEKEYEEYKEHLKKNMKNRVYTSWRNATGTDCKMIGPASKCFCDHRYRDHNYINPVKKMVKCNTKGCPCACFYHVPVHGSQDIKCLCKHSYKEHDVTTRKCKRSACKCPGFDSTWSCSCNLQFRDHITIVETREERIKLGKPVDDMTRLMGDFDVGAGNNLTSFTALVDGAERFENQDWGPVKEHYQQKAIEGGYSKPALTNQVEKDPTGKQITSLSGKQQLATKQMDELPTAFDLYNTPHCFGGKTLGKKTLARKPINY